MNPAEDQKREERKEGKTGQDRPFARAVWSARAIRKVRVRIYLTGDGVAVVSERGEKKEEEKRGKIRDQEINDDV